MKFEMVRITSAPEITPKSLNMARPLLEAIALAATEIRRRVTTTGRAAEGGRFRSYAPDSDKSGPRRFLDTGAMWNSLRVHLESPTKASTKFVGRRRAAGRRGGKRSQATLAEVLQDAERAPILGINNAEIDDLYTLLSAALNDQSWRAFGFAARRFRQRRKAARLKRRAERALRKLGTGPMG